MEVEFELTEDDLIAFNRYQRMMKRRMAREEARRKKRSSCVVPGILGVGIGTTIVFFDVLWDALKIIGIAFLLLALLVVLGTWLARPANVVRRFLNQGRNVRLLKRRKVDISPAGIHAVGSDFDCRYAWPGVDWIEATDEYVFFFLNTEQAVVVPGAAFARDEEFASFVAQARRWHEATSLNALSEFRAWQESEQIERD